MLKNISFLTRRLGESWTKPFLYVVLIVMSLIVIFRDSFLCGPESDVSCYGSIDNLLTELNDEEPKHGASLFFHETSCRTQSSDIHITPRQACAVESALLAHPNRDVFLLISSPVVVHISDIKNVVVKELLTYPNFRVRHISFSKYLSNTPLAVIDQAEALLSSKHPVSHASDILRYATLFKFGGIYLDLDFIILRSLDSLANFAGAESNSSLGAAALGFGLDKVGREMATDCALELARTFDGDEWGHNGPGVITRVLRRRCQTEEVSEMISQDRCKGFNVLPIDSFTALPFRDRLLFFSEDKEDKIGKMFNRSYAIHYWNKYTSTIGLTNDSNTPFIKYATIYCPKITRSVGGRF